MPGLLSQTSNVLASILGAVRDPQFRSDVRQGLLDAGNRGAVAGLLGGPVDLATMALRPLGYAVDKPVGGSEWIGQKMQDAGLVSGNRNALAEGLASIALPAAAPMLGRGVYAAEQAAARNASIAGPSSGPMGKERGIFGGIGAKTADKRALERAQAMIQKGDAPADVWKQTGWAQGPDGKWRFEIDDSAAKLRDYSYTPQEAFKESRMNAFINGVGQEKVSAMEPYASMTKNQLLAEYKRTGGEIVAAAQAGNKDEAIRLAQDRAGLDGLLGAMRERDYGPASTFLSHGQLGDAYPDVYKLHTRVDKYLPDNVAGQYVRGSPTQGEQVVLSKRPTWSDDKSNMLHELQHVVQNREGFARGGSADAVRRDPLAFADPQWVEYAKTLPAYKARATDADKQDFIRSFVEMRLGSPMDAYHRLGGEAEARLVQSRMNMTPSQRLDQFPWSPDYFQNATGVPINSLLLVR